MFKIKLKRGRKIDLPPEAEEGLLILTKDTHELYVGQGTGNSLAQVSGDKANTLNGLTASITELNYITGVNAKIQTQIDNINNNKSDKTNTYSKTEVDNLYNHLNINKLQISDFNQGVDLIIDAEKGQPDGLVPLGPDGMIPSQYMQSLALSNGVGVSTDADQLALSPSILIAIRTDLNKTFVRNGGNTGTMADWLEMKTPTNAVSSVAGKVGNIMLNTSDITGLDNILTSKADSSHQHYYNDLLDKPDLSILHSHDNLNVLDKFDEKNGSLQYNGNTISTSSVLNNYKAIVDPTTGDDFSDGYSVGSIWINTITQIAFICMKNEIGNAVWKKTTSLDGDSGMPKLSEISTTSTVAGNSLQHIDIDCGYSKYDIRTLYAKSNEGNNVNIELYDMAVNGFLLYRSLHGPEIYDIVNVPCIDKDNDNKVHMVIKNEGALTTTVQIVIKITSLL